MEIYCCSFIITAALAVSGTAAAVHAQEEAVAAAHAVLHWRGVSRGSLRASVGPLASSLLEVAQKGALMKSDVTAAVRPSTPNHKPATQIFITGNPWLENSIELRE